MELIARNLGPRQKLDVELRHPRPVYFVPVRSGSEFVAGFMASDPDSWNEEQPFATKDRTPQYEPPKADDPNKGTRDEKRRGPFPLAVAVETTVPAEWTDPKATATKAASLAGAGATGDAAAVGTLAAVPPATDKQTRRSGGGDRSRRTVHRPGFVAGPRTVAADDLQLAARPRRTAAAPGRRVGISAGAVEPAGRHLLDARHASGAAGRCSDSSACWC